MGRVLREGERVWIDGVRRVSWDTGEMSEFASCLCAALENLGRPVPYARVMGTTGTAFRFVMDPGAWNPGNYGILNLFSDRTAPIRRALAAEGWAFDLREPGDVAADTALLLASLDRGVPALGWPVVGPSDCVVLTGYDRAGEVVMGWSTYQDIPQDHTEPPDSGPGSAGYFRKTGWHAHCRGLLLIGDPGEPPPDREVYRDALARAAELIAGPAVGRLATGLRGLETWAAEMTDARWFPTGDADTLAWRYLGTAINMTQLRDACLAEPFLRDAAAVLPEAARPLEAAAGRYAAVARIRTGMEELIPDDFREGTMQAIADPSVRAAYAAGILRIRDEEAAALEQLRALSPA